MAPAHASPAMRLRTPSACSKEGERTDAHSAELERRDPQTAVRRCARSRPSLNASQHQSAPRIRILPSLVFGASGGVIEGGPAGAFFSWVSEVLQVKEALD